MYYEDPMRGLEGLAIDGTSIVLRLRTTGWEVTRSLNHHGRGGAAISAIFHKLVSKHVPT
jgi:shikimate 5-dehydrogenase